MKEKQLRKADPSKAIKADPRFDLSLISVQENQFQTRSHEFLAQHRENEEEYEKEKGKGLKTKKKRGVKQAEEQQRASLAEHSSHTSSPSFPHKAPSKKSFSSDIALSSALRAELASGSSKKRGASTPYSTHASDYENEEVPLDLDVVLPGKKAKKVKGPAPVSAEVRAAALKLSKSQRRKLESIEKRKELAEKVRTCIQVLSAL